MTNTTKSRGELIRGLLADLAAALKHRDDVEVQRVLQVLIAAPGGVEILLAMTAMAQVATDSAAQLGDEDHLAAVAAMAEIATDAAADLPSTSL